MTRKLTLGVAGLALAGVVALAVRTGLRTGNEDASIAAVPQDAHAQPFAVITDDELTSAAPDAPIATTSGEAAMSERVPTPDPLEPVVEYLRSANPALYGDLTADGARTLTEVDFGSAPIVDVDLGMLEKLPAAKYLRVPVLDFSAGFGGNVSIPGASARLDIRGLSFEPHSGQ